MYVRTYVHACTYIQTLYLLLSPFLTPSSYSLPTAPTEPNYYSTTHSFSQHARVSPRKVPNTSTSGKNTTATKEKVCTYVRICMHTHMELVEAVYICMYVNTHTVHAYVVRQHVCYCTKSPVLYQYISAIYHIRTCTYLCTVGTVHVQYL